jgi:hypothetical protein
VLKQPERGFAETTSFHLAQAQPAEVKTSLRFGMSRKQFIHQLHRQDRG